jgi:hypothetical protein
MSGYIGTQPVPQATQTRDSFTCTAGQTSFATGGYTPQFLDVYLNGIFLNNGTDYTASNGSDVILTVGAAADDTLEVVAYTTFEVVTDTVTNAGTVLNLDRTGSDGTILDVQKDGSTVGSIGTYNDYMTVGSGDTGLLMYHGGDVIRPHNMSTNAARDSAIDLGSTSDRFKDLYLSGGVYLGGTGSANKLDDYEEGTWTPTYTSSSTDPTFSPNLQNGVYTKIGRMVYASFRLRGAITGTKTGNLQISGLPFTNNNSPATGSGAVQFTESFGTNKFPTGLGVQQSGTYINLTTFDSDSARNQQFTSVDVASTSGSSSGNYIIGHVVYQTD